MFVLNFSPIQFLLLCAVSLHMTCKESQFDCTHPLADLNLQTESLNFMEFIDEKRLHEVTWASIVLLSALSARALH